MQIGRLGREPAEFFAPVARVVRWFLRYLCQGVLRRRRRRIVAAVLSRPNLGGAFHDAVEVVRGDRGHGFKLVGGLSGVQWDWVNPYAGFVRFVMLAALSHGFIQGISMRAASILPAPPPFAPPSSVLQCQVSPFFPPFVHQGGCAAKRSDSELCRCPSVSF